MMPELEMVSKKILPLPIYRILRRFWTYFIPSIYFLGDYTLNLPIKEKLRIVKQLGVISSEVHCPHAQNEMLKIIRTILSLPSESKGVIVEAGCFKGGSTAKLSLAAGIVGRDLVVFDSFKGLPETDEPHDKTIFGDSLKGKFKKGVWCGNLEEVKSNVARFGKIDRCRFVEGYFEDTMPQFGETISAIYLDVDLALSTRTCLKYLFPLLEDGGALYSHDGHFPLVIDVFNDSDFWLKEVGCIKPSIQGLGKRRFLKIIKEAR